VRGIVRHVLGLRGELFRLYLLDFLGFLTLYAPISSPFQADLWGTGEQFTRQAGKVVTA
jgi:hypothetical protein